MNKIVQNKWRIVRRIVQLSTILLLLSPLLKLGIFRGTLISGELFGMLLVDPFAAIDFMSAAKTIYMPLVIGALIVAVFYFIVGGRAFCGWVCPIYLLSEFAAKLHKKFAVYNKKPSEFFKYYIFVIFLLLSVVTSKPVFELISPIGIISQNIALGVDRPQSQFGKELDGSVDISDSGYSSSLMNDSYYDWQILFNSSLWLVVLILLIDIFFSKGWWCRFACPVGTFYTLLGKFSPVKIKIDNSACTKCNECFDVCLPSNVLIDPVQGKTNWVVDSSCTNCLNCIDICPENALKISIKIKKENLS